MFRVSNITLPANFTDEQRAAALTLGKPMALIAAAGSGKTTVLVQRYLELLRRGLSPSQILTVTFTNEAADQMRRRILAHLAESGASEPTRRAVETTPRIGTIHSFCYGLLAQYGSAVGLAPIRGILSSFDLATAFESGYESWLRGLAPASLRRLLGYFSHSDLRSVVNAIFKQRHTFRRALKLPADGPCAEADRQVIDLLEELVAPLLDRLETDLHRRGLYAFDDLEHSASRILSETPAVAKALQNAVRQLLVDEFQDTSRLQWGILERIVGEEPEKLFVVGDPKQSIYGFRHADVRLFLSVTKELETGGGLVRELTMNFRSDPPLLEAINRLSFSFFEGSHVPFSAMRPAIASEIDLRRENPLRVERYGAAEKADLSRAEIRKVVAEAKALVQDGEDPASLAILFRVSDRIEDYFHALEEAGLPVVCKRSARLFDSLEIVDLLWFLKAVEDPFNSFALAAFLRSRYVGFDYARIWGANQAPGETLYEKLLSLREPELLWFFALIESGEFRAEAALGALLRSTPYFPEQTAAVLEWLGPIAGKGWSVTEAVTKLSGWEKEETLFQIEQGGERGVRLMTVHGAKGLEFPHVFLVDCLRQMPRRTPLVKLHPDRPVGLRYRLDSETVPTQSYERLQEEQAQSDEEESKRILYVALTRARKTLTLFLPDDTRPIPKGSWAQLLEEGLRRG